MSNKIEQLKSMLRGIKPTTARNILIIFMIVVAMGIAYVMWTTDKISAAVEQIKVSLQDKFGKKYSTLKSRQK